MDTTFDHNPTGHPNEGAAKKRVLLTDDCHPLLKEGLEKMGLACDFEPTISPDEVFEKIPAYSGLVINSKIKVDRRFLKRAERLKFVARLGSGREVVDLEVAAEHGVAAIFSPEGNRNAVAEQALGMLLALSNNLLRADREVRQKIWRREANRGWELAGKTLGIIGFGHTGSQFARKLAGMELRVLAFDKYLPAGFAREMAWVEEVNLPEIFEQADIISLHLPLAAETHHFADAEFFRKCRPGAVLLNTSRGSCVDTAALVEALESGQLGGACLDVFENEQVATFSEAEAALYERLYRRENVVLTPHIAGWTLESKRLLAEVLLQKIQAVLTKGEQTKTG